MRLILLLACALAPSLVLLLCISIKDTSLFKMAAVFVILLNGASSLKAGHGLLAKVRDDGVRALLSLLLSAAIFVFNIFLVIAVGCSRDMGSFR